MKLLLFGVGDDVVRRAGQILQILDVAISDPSEGFQLRHMQTISESFDALVCDLDGVFYRGDEVIPGVPETVQRLQQRGLRLLYCTNNSGDTVERYVAKLAGMGIVADIDSVLTSGVVTGEELARRGLAGRSAFVVGGEGARTAVADAGLALRDGEEGASADVVIVGIDRSFTWDKMRIATRAVIGGATFIATNSDVTYPAADGIWPGAGAILQSIEAAAGRRAEVMGKPFRPMMEAAARRLGGSTRVAVVGDRNDTDLDGGRLMGWGTVLVLTGVTTAEQADGLSPAPDLVVESFADLH